MEFEAEVLAVVRPTVKPSYMLVGMTTTYERLSDPAEVLRRVADIAPKTVIFDVEPLVAFWDTNQTSLDNGIEATLAGLQDVPGIEVVVFATNSLRRPGAIASSRAGTQVLYYASARKPTMPALRAWTGDAATSRSRWGFPRPMDGARSATPTLSIRVGR